MDLLASIIAVAPSLTLALSSASALPGVLALSGTKPVLRLIDVAVNHELSRFLILLPVVAVEVLLVGEEFTEMVWVGLSLSSLSGSQKSSNDNRKLHS